VSLQFEQIQTTERSHWLDVLRGLAIFGVVAVHSIQSTDSLVLHNKSEFFFWMVSLGKYGVELFFFCQAGYSYQSMGQITINLAKLTGHDGSHAFIPFGFFSY